MSSAEPIDLDKIQARIDRLTVIYPPDSVTGIVVHSDVPALIAELRMHRVDFDAYWEASGMKAKDRLDAHAELRNRAEAAEAKLANVRASLSRLIDQLHETSSGLGEWHDATEYIDWAQREVRDIWLAIGGGA